MTMNPDDLAALEEERRFLLRSLRDLEREFAVGDVDVADYQSLRDGYTARAAAVMKAIDDERAVPAPRRSRRAAIGWVAVTVVVAVAIGWFLAARSGPRSDGADIAAGEPSDQISAKLAEARANLGSNPGLAADAYIAVLRIDARNVEALTYSGWLIVQQGSATGAQDLVVLGAKNMRDSIALDPGYADAHCFLALTSANHLDPPDLDTARVEAQACLDNNPPAQMVQMIQAFLDRLNADTTDDG